MDPESDRNYVSFFAKQCGNATEKRTFGGNNEPTKSFLFREI